MPLARPFGVEGDSQFGPGMDQRRRAARRCEIAGARLDSRVWPCVARRLHGRRNGRANNKNRYAYAKNKPLSFTDPSGHDIGSVGSRRTLLDQARQIELFHVGQYLTDAGTDADTGNSSAGQSQAGLYAMALRADTQTLSQMTTLIASQAENGMRARWASDAAGAAQSAQNSDSGEQSSTGTASIGASPGVTVGSGIEDAEIGHVIVEANRTSGRSDIHIDDIARQRVDGYDLHVQTVFTQLLLSTRGSGERAQVPEPVVLDPGQVLLDFLNLTTYPARVLTPAGQIVDRAIDGVSLLNDLATRDYGGAVDTAAGMGYGAAMRRVALPLGDRFADAWGAVWGVTVENAVRPSQICQGANANSNTCR